MVGFFSTGFFDTRLMLFILFVSTIALPQKGFGSEKKEITSFSYDLLLPQGVLHRDIRQRVGPHSSPSSNSPEEDSFKKLEITSSTLGTDVLRKKYSWWGGPPKVIGAIGDTGCRLKEHLMKSTYQNCSNPQEWRYPTVAESLSTKKPDLIIHLGDFHYREQCSSKELCEKFSEEVGYGWIPWKLDFFAASGSLLSSAPWLIVRGNHEDCRRAYLGYKFLLATAKWPTACEEYEEPVIFDFGNLVIVNIDSSSIPDVPSALSQKTEEKWKQKVDMIGQRLAAVGFEPLSSKPLTKILWVVSHKPVYGIADMGNSYTSTNTNLKSYLEKTTWFNKTQLILSGHVHNSQIIQIKGKPLQIVMGNGGTSLDKFKPPISPKAISNMGYTQARIVSQEFGYLIIKWEKNGRNNHLQFFDSNGKITLSCRSGSIGESCFH